MNGGCYQARHDLSEVAKEKAELEAEMEKLKRKEKFREAEIERLGRANCTLTNKLVDVRQTASKAVSKERRMAAELEKMRLLTRQKGVKDKDWLRWDTWEQDVGLLEKTIAPLSVPGECVAPSSSSVLGGEEGLRNSWEEEKEDNSSSRLVVTDTQNSTNLDSPSVELVSPSDQHSNQSPSSTTSQELQSVYLASSSLSQSSIDVISPSRVDLIFPSAVEVISPKSELGRDHPALGTWVNLEDSMDLDSSMPIDRNVIDCQETQEQGQGDMQDPLEEAMLDTEKKSDSGVIFENCAGKSVRQPTTTVNEREEVIIIDDDWDCRICGHASHSLSGWLAHTMVHLPCREVRLASHLRCFCCQWMPARLNRSNVLVALNQLVSHLQAEHNHPDWFDEEFEEERKKLDEMMELRVERDKEETPRPNGGRKKQAEHFHPDWYDEEFEEDRKKLDVMLDKSVERDNKETHRPDVGGKKLKTKSGRRKMRLNLQAVLEPCNQCGKVFSRKQHLT